MTDIENEPDDAMSFVRFLTYSNQFDIEASWQRPLVSKGIRLQSGGYDITTAYGKVRDNLLIHESGFPTEEYIHSVIKKGLPVLARMDWGRKRLRRI